MVDPMAKVIVYWQSCLSITPMVSLQCAPNVNALNPTQIGLLSLLHHPIYAGVKIVVLSKFALDTWCQAVQDYKITYAYVVPPILLGLSKAPIVDNYDLTSIKVFVSAAAPLTKEIVHAVWNRLKIPVKQAYGLSETSPATHFQVLILHIYNLVITS